MYRKYHIGFWDTCNISNDITNFAYIWYYWYDMLDVANLRKNKPSVDSSIDFEIVDLAIKVL